MARSRTSAKAAGTRMERVTSDYLRDALGIEFIDRKALSGSRDTGDIGGVRAHDQRVVIEVKDCSRMELSAWVKEAEIEAVNDGALCGLVVAKRRGVADPAQQYVFLTLGHLAALLTGDRSHWMKEGGK